MKNFPATTKVKTIQDPKEFALDGGILEAKNEITN